MHTIIPNFDETNNIPLYIQLYKYIRTEIMTKRIGAGTKLPSIRSLSSHLNISRITVNNAYQQLISEGYIESRERSGMYVLDIDVYLRYENIPNIDISDEYTELSTVKTVDFKYGDIDIDSFNFALWRRLASQAIQESNKDLLLQCDPQGEKSLRLEICKYLRSSRGVLCSPDQIVITSGTQYSLYLICDLLKDSFNTVSIENPGWLRAKQVFENHGFKINPVELDDKGFSIAELPQEQSIIYITPSHQYPMGMVMPIARRQQLLSWAKSTRSYIIEDDYDSEFRYKGRPIPSLQGLDSDDRVIYLGSFSKLLAPSLRMSYVVLPPSMLKLYRSNIYSYQQSTSRIDQNIIQLFMSNDYWDRHIRKMRRIYSKKNTVLLESIEKYLGRRVNIVGGDSGLHVLIEVLCLKDEEALMTRAKKHGVKVYSISKNCFNNKRLDNPHMLLGFGGLSEEEIIDGVRLLSHAID